MQRLEHFWECSGVWLEGFTEEFTLRAGENCPQIGAAHGHQAGSYVNPWIYQASPAHPTPSERSWKDAGASKPLWMGPRN